MGGKGGGETVQTPSSQTVNSYSEPWTAQQQYYKDIFSEAQKLYGGYTPGQQNHPSFTL